MTALLLLSALLVPAPPGPPVAWWPFTAVPHDDGSVRVEIKAVLEPGWHLYATWLSATGGPLPTVFRFKPSEDFEVVGELMEPRPEEEYDPNFGMLVQHHSGSPVFTLSLRRRSSGAFIVEGELEYMVCNEMTCLPPVLVPFSVPVEALAAK